MDGITNKYEPGTWIYEAQRTTNRSTVRPIAGATIFEHPTQASAKTTESAAVIFPFGYRFDIKQLEN